MSNSVCISFAKITETISGSYSRSVSLITTNSTQEEPLYEIEPQEQKAILLDIVMKTMNTSIDINPEG